MMKETKTPPNHQTNFKFTSSLLTFSTKIICQLTTITTLHRTFYLRQQLKNLCRLQPQQLCCCSSSLLATAKLRVLRPPTNNRNVPVWWPLCRAAAFFNCTIFCNAWYRMIPYRISVTNSGRNPVKAVSRINSEGTTVTNQHTRPPLVSPIQPMAGRKPIIKPL